jgi:hypothetical protein
VLEPDDRADRFPHFQSSVVLLFQIVACAEEDVPACVHFEGAVKEPSHDLTKISPCLDDDSTLLTCKFEALPISATARFYYGTNDPRVVVEMQAGDRPFAFQAKYNGDFKAQVWKIEANQKCRFVRHKTNVKAIHIWDI